MPKIVVKQVAMEDHNVLVVDDRGRVWRTDPYGSHFSQWMLPDDPDPVRTLSPAPMRESPDSLF